MVVGDEIYGTACSGVRMFYNFRHGRVVLPNTLILLNNIMLCVVNSDRFSREVSGFFTIAELEPLDRPAHCSYQETKLSLSINVL